MQYYDIIFNTMISYVLWYHRNNHDIIFNIMISHMWVISQCQLWYHTMMSACDMICDIMRDTGPTVFIQQPQVALWVFEPCACTWYMISPMTSYTISFYDSTYDIVYNNIVWYHTIWFHIWYHIIWNDFIYDIT